MAETQAERGARILREVASESVDVAGSAEVGADSPRTGDVNQTGVTQQTGEAEADRHERIAVLAYSKARERAFAPGGELDDWLAAEREIDQEQSAVKRDQAQ